MQKYLDLSSQFQYLDDNQEEYNYRKPAIATVFTTNIKDLVTHMYIDDIFHTQQPIEPSQASYRQHGTMNLEISALLQYSEKDLPMIGCEKKKNRKVTRKQYFKTNVAKIEQNKQIISRVASKQYKKNLMGYISRKAIDIMFKFHQKYLFQKCKQLDLIYTQFKMFYEQIQGEIYGPKSLTRLFEVDPQSPVDKKRKDLFLKVFKQILRKKYMIYSLKQGKMQIIDTYIRQKNSHLLYLPHTLRQMLRSLSQF